jgi:DNA-binding beta-propeller fold protein YncE
MRRTVVAAGLVTAAFATPVLAKRVPIADPRVLGGATPAPQSSVSFALAGRPLGGAKPAEPTPAYLTASRIAAVPDGALVIDADSGNLIRTDRAGKRVGTLMIGGSAGLLAYDPAGKLAYVADRLGNRIAVVQVGDALRIVRAISTPVEPYAVALSPDRTTIFATTIADRTLVAYDAATGRERWHTALGREPRGLAISPDGTRALVAYLTTGTVDQIDLLETHTAVHVALATESREPCTMHQDIPSQMPPRKCGADIASFARGAFAVTFLGEHQAVVPFQRETPVQATTGDENTGSYGGGFEAPITHQLAFLGFDRGRTQQLTAAINEHQPRALAWDSTHDVLYVAGMGNDSLVQIKNASQISIALGGGALLANDGACGPDGLAIASDGKVLVWCAFSRRIERVDVGPAATTVSPGPTLIASAMTDTQHQGYVLFHTPSFEVSRSAALACASCHPEGRADGLSWRIDSRELQTPLLAGRLVGTHPFKWDGGDPTLRDSLSSTMKRLGGSGLGAADTGALAAYLESVAAPRTPTVDPSRVARGKQLFDSGELGCASCHDGNAYTDRQKHKLGSKTLPEADTPSLIGLAASAPYYHDGSAATLEALLRDRGAVHGMAETAKLTDAQVADLTAYLQSL